MITDDATIREILATARTIAVVGASANPARPSYGVMRFLQRHGHRIVPVNPGLAGKTLMGETVHARLSDIPFAVDMVDIFRRPDAVDAVVDAALALQPRPAIIWMQLGVIAPEAAARAEAAGLQVVMDRCPAIETRRLGLGVAQP
ncbi:MAG: CoA-binding protein [Rubellimicrobium sp.]|nr:CoA-binding protein [Rubellimicrobium sp.]